MKKILSLIAIVSMLVMVIPMFAPMVHAAGQPPIDTTTYWEGTIGWGPFDSDPGIIYDTGSGELAFNSYEGLLAFNGEQYYTFTPLLSENEPNLVNHTMTVTNTSSVGTDPVGSTWTDGSKAYTLVWFIDEKLDGFHAFDVIYLTDGTTWYAWQVDSMSGTSTITLNLFRGSYTFKIRTTPDIFFYNNLGEKVGKLTLEDAVYTFQRYQVMCNIVGASPMWMYDKPFYDVPDHTVFDNSNAMMLAHLINDSIVGNPATNELTLNIGTHYPDNAFKQMLSNSWGAIGSKNNTIAMGSGCWDGDLFSTAKHGGPQPDWWIDWANEGPGMQDTYETDAFPSNELLPERYIGTGPYHISTIDDVNLKVIMQRNPDYWRGWPAPGRAGSLDTIEIDYIASWDTRKAQFLAGAIDTCAVPRAYMFQLLDNVTKQPTTPGIKTITQIIPPLSLDVYLFGLVINPGSTHVGTGVIPDGIPNDFFNFSHTRRAFAYAFNASAFNEQVFFGESDYRKNCLALGLYPDYYNESAAPTFSINYAAAENELKQAIYNGTSLWDSGFKLELVYNTGNDIRRIACTMISTFMTTLSTFDGRTGKPPFQVVVKEMLWSAMLPEQRAKLLPMWDVGWLADYADADDFIRPYMHSSGGYSYGQRYTAANGYGTLKDVLIDQAILTPDGPARQALYDQLAMIYYNDCPSFPVNNPRGRVWQWYWVKGYYYDAVYPSRYFRNIWKQDQPWYDISGTPSGTSDNVVNMKDIAYLIAHFNAKAPVPGLPTDPKWVGDYGANGAVDPFGDRVSNMKDIAGAISNFNAKGPGHP